MRMVGECTERQGKLEYTGTIQHILALGNFKVKMMVYSGNSNSKIALEKMGDGPLGHVWDPDTDLLHFPINLHLGKRKRDGTFAGPLLTPENTHLLHEMVWTPATVLSITASIYDPLGQICPITIKLRIFLRSVLSQGKID